MRGAFVPPFVKKAMDGPGDNEAEGPLSARTLQMLAGSFLARCPSATLHLPAAML